MKNRIILLLILAIFFLSGMSALLYQVAWQRLLTIYYGVGFYSVTLIVSIYMFGLGLGGYFGGLLAERSKNKISTYLIIEILIGAFGIMSPKLLSFLGQHTAGVNYTVASALIFAFLSVPTFLMGTTLPMLVKIYNKINKNFLSSVSVLYFINTLGAALGALISTYILVSFFGLDKTIYFAVLLNLFIGITVFAILGRRFNKEEEVYEKDFSTEPIDNSDWKITNKKLYGIVFITGFIAIGYELVWFRVISVLTKDSAYSFSTVLFIYLLGLAIGSYLMNVIGVRLSVTVKRKLYFSLQFLMGIFVLASFYLFYKLNTFPNFFSTLADQSFNSMVHPDFSLPHSFRELILKYDIFFWPLILLIIPTIVMGASFPLVTYLGMKNKDEEGKTVGVIYFFNVLGNVLGGILTGILILPLLKTTGTILLFSSVNILFILGIASSKKSLLYIIVPILILVNYFIFPSNQSFYKAIHSGYPDKFKTTGYNTVIEEGKESVVVTYYDSAHLYRNFINGSNHGSRPGYSYFNEVIEAFKYHPSPTNVFVLGFGAGSIVEAAERNPLTEKVTMVEINSVLMKNLEKIDEVKKIINHPKLNWLIEDGRRFLLNDSSKYDVIFIDPLRMETAYSNNIHSKEFFELLKGKLKPNGILMVGGQEHPIKENTLMSVFKHIRSYSYFMLGSETPFVVNDKSFTSIWNAFNEKEKNNIKHEFSFVASDELLREELKYYPINTDWKPFTEYFMATKYRTNKILRKCEDFSGGNGTVARVSEAGKEHKLSFAYQASFDQIESITEVGGGNESNLPDDLLISSGKYNVFGKSYVFNRQGVYRFSARLSKRDIQRIVFNGDLDTLVSSISWICTHSEKDDKLTNLQKTEVAKYRKLTTQCGPVSAWAKYILELAGFKVRTVLGATLEEWDIDNGHTMIEVYNSKANKWQVYDITNNSCFSLNGVRLSFIEFYKAIKQKREIQLVRLATDSQYDYSGFSTKDDYYYTLGAERIATLNALMSWYKREFQVAMIEDERGFNYFNDKSEAEKNELLKREKTYLPMDTTKFINKFYK